MTYVEKDSNYDYPYENKNDLMVKFYIKFTSAISNAGITNVTTYVLNLAAVEGEKVYSLYLQFNWPHPLSYALQYSNERTQTPITFQRHLIYPQGRLI